MLNFKDPDYQIGRGETAESQLEFPFFAAIMLVSAVLLLVVHSYFQNISLTIALSISAIILGITILRVDLGVFVLVVAMLLSPEIDAGKVGIGNRALNVRYNDGLIIIVFIGVLVKCAFEGRSSLWLPNPINSGIVLYYAVCLLSSMYAYQRALPAFDTHESLFTLLKMAEFYMLFVLVGNAIRSMKQVRRQTYLFFAVAMVVSIYGMYARFFTGMERVSAPFELGGTEPNTLGGYLVLVMCIAGGLYTQAKKKHHRMLLLGLIAVAFFPFLFTLSRASYLAFIVGVLALGISARHYTTIAAIALLLILSPFIMPKDVRDRVNNTIQTSDGADVTVGGYETGVQVDKSTGERLYVWKKVGFNLRVWPWLGGGVSWGRVLDSQYARVLIESGILGCAAFVFLQFRIITTVHQSYRFAQDWFGRGISIGIFAGTIALIVHSLGTVSFIIVRIMEPYWFLVALSVTIRALAIEEFVRNKQRQQQTVPAAPTVARPTAA